MEQMTRFFETIRQNLGLRIKLPKVTNRYSIISVVVIIISLICSKFSGLFLIATILAGGNLYLINRKQ